MKNSEFFSTPKNDYESNGALNYWDELTSVMTLQAMMVVFNRQTFAGAVLMVAFFGIYGIPLALLLAFSGRIIGNGIVRVVYAIFGTSRKVRWTTNSWINLLMYSWFWIWTGGALFMIFILITFIPYALVTMLTAEPGTVVNAGDPTYNLLVRYVMGCGKPSSLWEFTYNVFLGDDCHPVAKVVKFFLSSCVGYFLTYHGHNEISESEFMEGEETGADGWLLYEKISRN